MIRQANHGEYPTRPPDNSISIWLCLIVIVFGCVWIFTTEYWPQALMFILLALAILMKR